MSEKQTAVEWLIEQLDNNIDIKHSWRTKQYIEQAKEMEKQQMIDAHSNGRSILPPNENGEQYYINTYE